MWNTITSLFFIVVLFFLPHQSCIAKEKSEANTFSIERVYDPDTAIARCKSLLKHSVAIDSPDGAFMAWIGMSIKYWEKQEFEKDRACCDSAIPWARRSTQKDAVAWCYSNKGEAYYFEGDYIAASQCLYTALDELKKVTGDEPNHTWANIYNALGRINMRLNQPAKALEYFKIAEDACKKGKLYFQLGENYTERGIYCNSIGKHDSAAWYFNRVMDIGLQINKRDLQAIANCNLGRTAIETGRYDEALVYLQRSLDLSMGVYYYVATDALYAMGDVLGRLGRYKEAENILQSALQKTKQYHRRDLTMDVYDKLEALYRATGRYKQALNCMDSIVLLKDLLSSISKTTAYNQLELKYKTVQKDKELAQNQLLIARQQSKLTRKNIWIGIIVGSVFLLAVVVFAVTRNARQKERLQAEQIRSLKQENKIGMLKAAVLGEENERSRIARELHDGIGGMLAAAMMRLGTIPHDNEGVTRSAGYNEGMKMLGQMGDEIRKTAHNLMPEVLQKQSLADAVRSYCNNMQGKDGLKIDFQLYGQFHNLPGDIKLHLYRIVQELLKNVRQHARAKHALVQLMMDEQTLAITVEDDGCGFDKNMQTSGIGLHNVETRVQSHGGNYSIESSPGNGTTVYIEFEQLILPQT